MTRDAREQAKRAALKALMRARRAAELAGAKLSDWEGEFLGSVEARIETYGRAFADPEKGAAGDSLSLLQRLKLKEIAAKAKAAGKPPAPKLPSKTLARKPFRARRALGAGPRGTAR
jgi:hypothetical protein